MPQIKAAKKALRVSNRRRAINDRWRLKFRAGIRQVNDAVANGDPKAAVTALTEAHKNIDRAARRNILHPKTADRKKSRLAKAVNRLS